MLRVSTLYVFVLVVVTIIMSRCHFHAVTFFVVSKHVDTYAMFFFF